MKSISAYINIVLTSVMLLMASCQKEDIPAQQDNRTDVIITAKLTDYTMEVKGSGEAGMVNCVACAIFSASGNGYSAEPVAVQYFPMESLKAKIPLTLVKNQSYRIVLFALHKTDAGEFVYNLGNFKEISVADKFSLANSEELDAFTAYKDIKVGEGSTIVEVDMERPLAKLNIGVPQLNWDESANNGKTPAISEISVTTTAYAFNAFEGKVAESSNAGTIVLKRNGISDSKFEADGKEYKYLAWGYLFANPKGGSQLKVDIEFTVSDNNNTEIYSSPAFSDVPLTANYQTNICGNILK